jgi:hypothetical protein
MHESYSQPSLTPSGGSVSRAKRQTETLTLRIDKELLDELRKESDEKLLSLNTLANQIIKLYIKWYSPCTKSWNYVYSKMLSSFDNGNACRL